MKKMIFVLTVLLAAPVMATVTISCSQDGLYGQGNDDVVISYVATSDSNLPRGFGLEVTVDSGKTIDAVTYTNPDYWVYPGSIVIDANDPPEVVDYGTPVASGLGTGTVILEMGSLHYPTGPDSPNAPDLSAVLIKLDLSGTGCNVTVSGNGTRGNVVDYDAAELVENEDLIYSPPCVMYGECFTNLVPLEYTNWTHHQKPPCWCFKRQCRGDIDGLKLGPLWVSNLDLAIFKPCLGKSEAQLQLLPGCYCADLDHLKLGPLWISNNDLIIIKQYIGKAEAIVKCCDASQDCVLTPPEKWSFWTN